MASARQHPVRDHLQQQPDDPRALEQHLADGRIRRADSAAVRARRVRAPATTRSPGVGGERVDAGGTDHPAGGRPHRVRPPVDRPLQDPGRHDPGRGRVRDALCDPGAPGLHGIDPERDRRGRGHRRRLTAACVLQCDPATPPAGGHHGDRRHVGRGLQRLHGSAVLPARQSERHRAADPVQLPEPVQHSVEPAVRRRGRCHDPAADHVPLLPAPDRLRADDRRGTRLIDEGLPGPVRIAAVRTRLPAGVLGFGHEPLTLSWRVEAADPDAEQLEWVIERSSTPTFDSANTTSASGQTADQVDVAVPGPPLRSRETAWLRVRIRTHAGWTSWSPSLAVEAGLLDPADWTADAVTLPDDPGAVRPAPSPIVRREFTVPGTVARARLHVTSLGLNLVTINGRPVTADLLGPGWTPYRRRLLSDTFDVTTLIGEGPNAIGAMLGDGWFRGRLGWNPDGDRGAYGHEVALLAQLEIDVVDGSRMVGQTDRTWRASTAAVFAADRYDGASIDLRRRQDHWDEPGFDDHQWLPVAVVPIDRSTIEPRTAPPVRSIATLPVMRTDRGSGRILLDGGQNIAGFGRLRVRGARGTTVRVRHAEVLEPDGSLHVRSLRSAKATDEYIL